MLKEPESLSHYKTMHQLKRDLAAFGEVRKKDKLWCKTSASGRVVAPGLFWGLIRISPIGHLYAWTLIGQYEQGHYLGVCVCLTK